MSIVHAIVQRGQLRGHFGQLDRYSWVVSNIYVLSMVAGVVHTSYLATINVHQRI
jgi:hypothetical protein